MLTHENVVAGIVSVMMQLGVHKPNKDDTLLSFLPLAHMLERCCEVIIATFYDILYSLFFNIGIYIFSKCDNFLLFKLR